MKGRVKKKAKPREWWIGFDGHGSLPSAYNTKREAKEALDGIARQVGCGRCYKIVRVREVKRESAGRGKR